MTDLSSPASRSVLTLLFVIGAMPVVASAADLSRYRTFQLGTDLATIAKQADVDVSQASEVHRRPALIQELTWHPQRFEQGSRAEAVNEVVFTFYEGNLFKIVVKYDRYETEGMTTDDFAGALSAAYGIATGPAVPAVPAKASQGRYGEQKDVVAQWDDPLYHLELARSSYAPSFELSALSKKLGVPAHAAILEAQRLDTLEAPQRDAARIASEEAAAKGKLETIRLTNKAKFRP